MRKSGYATATLAFRRTFQGVYSGNVLFTYLDLFLKNYTEVLKLPEDMVEQEAHEFLANHFEKTGGKV